MWIWKDPVSGEILTTYGSYAIEAARAERLNLYGRAATLWEKARSLPCSEADREWAGLRKQFCQTAKRNAWGKSDGNDSKPVSLP